MSAQTAPTILTHVRIPAFGCAVAAARNSHLKDRPLVMVTGLHARGKVVELSPSAELLGVRLGTTLADLHRQHRDVIPFAPDRDAMAFAQKAMEGVLAHFSPQVETVSLGTLALDLSGTRRLWGEPLDAAERIATALKQETGFSSCLGIASLRVVSHVACQVARPLQPKWTPPGAERAFLEPLPVSILPGLGEIQVTQLLRLGIERVGQLMDLPDQLVLMALGPSGLTLVQKIRGHGINTVATAGKAPPQISETAYLTPDTNTEVALKGAVGVLAERSSRRLYEINKRAGHARLALTYIDGANVTRSAALDPATAQEMELFATTTRLLHQGLTRRVRVRRLDLVLDRLYLGGIQRALFSTPESMSQELSVSLGQATQKIRTRFGVDALRLGAAWVGDDYIRPPKEKDP